MDSIVETVASGDKVQLVGFGTFCVAKRAARKGHNPKTGEPMKIKAAKLPKFKPGKALKAAVNPAKKSGGKKKK